MLHRRGLSHKTAATRTREALWDTIGALLDSFSLDECQNYLTNCGYEPASHKNASS